MLGEVRAFTKEDIQQVADLHRRVFSTADHASPELWDSYQSYFTQIFLNDAWLDDDTRSLVYEEEGGRITGFFGAVARQMSFNGQVVRAKIGSQAIVDEGSRGLAGLKLYSAFLEGPQDLFIGDEGNSDSRRYVDAGRPGRTDSEEAFRFIRGPPCRGGPDLRKTVKVHCRMCRNPVASASL